MMVEVPFRWVVLSSILVLSGRHVASAQIRNDIVPKERTLPLDATVKAEAEDARFRLGPVRLLPRVNITNLGYNNNVVGATSSRPAVADWTAGIAAGLGYLVPFGSSTYLRGEVVPQYTWFKELSENRAWGGGASASILVLPATFRLEAGGRFQRETVFYSSERVVPVTEESQGARAQIDVFVTGRLSLFATGETRRTTYPGEGDAAFAATNRRENVVRGGFAYQAAEHVKLAASFERNRARFDREATLRDYQGKAYFGSILYDRERFYVNLAIGVRRYEADDSTFQTFSGATGGLFLSYFVNRRLEIQLAGRRGITNSISAVSSYFVETTFGTSVNYTLGRSLVLGGFAEIATNRYPEMTTSAAARRRDEITRFGGTISYPLNRFVILSGRMTRDELRSNVPGLDRSITYFNMGLSLSGTPKSGRN